MKRSNVSYTVKSLVEDINKEIILFNHPIQREGNQWNDFQKSLLIHSLADDSPIPELYAIPETVKREVKGKKIDTIVYQVLDGKQRSTAIRDFVNGDENFGTLHESTPHVEIDGEEFQLAGKTFEELDDEVKRRINDYMLNMTEIKEASDEDIEFMFYKLNHGVPLATQQKAKALMGKDWAIRLNELTQHPFISKAGFTKSGIKKSDHEVALVQTMMLLDESYDYKSLSTTDVAEYEATFKKDSDYKLTLLDQVTLAMEYLNSAFEEQEKVLLKRVHLPMMLITALKALEEDVKPSDFKLFAEDFKLYLKNKPSVRKTRYKAYSGAGSVKKNNAQGRLKEMTKHFNEFMKELEKKEEAKQEVAASSEEIEIVDIDDVEEANQDEVKDVEKVEF